MIKIAIVVLNFNGESFLSRFIPSLIAHSTNAQIFIVDNNSTDGSVSLVRKNFPEVSILEFDKNYGYTGGYNKALQLISAEHYVLLNSDVEVTENWLQPMFDFMEKNHEYAACQPKIKDWKNRNKFEYAGAAGGFLDTFGYPYCRGRIFDTTEEDTGKYDDEIDVFWASGACFWVRATDFHNCGGFDEHFFAHMEEIDLCWRLHSNNRKIRFLPSSTVYHEGGGTLKYQSSFKTYLNFRNGLYLLIKNLPLNQLFIKLPIRLLLDWGAILHYMVKNKGRHSLAILKAHGTVLLKCGKLVGKRDLCSPIKNKRMIVLDYYFKGKHTFS